MKSFILRLHEIKDAAKWIVSEAFVIELDAYVNVENRWQCKNDICSATLIHESINFPIKCESLAAKHRFDTYTRLNALLINFAVRQPFNIYLERCIYNVI
jgi:hypothetical protein